MIKGSRRSLFLMAAGPLAFYAVFVLLPLAQSLQISTWSWNGLGAAHLHRSRQLHPGALRPALPGSLPQHRRLARRGGHGADHPGAPAGRPAGPAAARQPPLQVGLLHAHHALAGGRRARSGSGSTSPTGACSTASCRRWGWRTSRGPGSADPETSLAAVIVAWCWQQTALSLILYLAALTTYPATSSRPPPSTGPMPGSASATSSCRSCGRPPSWSSRWPSSTR